MQTITLHQLCPLIFAQKEEHHSEVWHQEVTFRKGESYLIEAISGTGKSSLCSYLCGYRNDYEGRLDFDGKDARTYSVADWTLLRQKQISHLIQDLKLFPELTALENIAIKNNLTHEKKESEILTWMERLGIAEKRDTLLGKMSFGQQQRVAFIRALAQPFDFILVDEPVSHLDDYHAQLMADILQEEVARKGAGLIATSIGKRLPLTYEKILHL